jgi:hypothetical protein
VFSSFREWGIRIRSKARFPRKVVVVVSAENCRGGCDTETRREPGGREVSVVGSRY